MRIAIAVLALVLFARVPMAQGQITPADVPVLLNLVVANIGDELRRQDSRAVAAGVSVDPASLSAFQKLVPDLTALPSQGPSYRVGSALETTRGALLTIERIVPAENPGEYNVRVDPTLRGREGDTVVFRVTKKDGPWKVIDGLVVVE